MMESKLTPQEEAFFQRSSGNKPKTPENKPAIEKIQARLDLIKARLGYNYDLPPENNRLMPREEGYDRYMYRNNQNQVVSGNAEQFLAEIERLGPVSRGLKLVLEADIAELRGMSVKTKYDKGDMEKMKALIASIAHLTQQIFDKQNEAHRAVA